MATADAAALAFCNLIWGATYVVARGVLDATPPLVLAFVRSLIAGVGLYLLDRRERQGRRAEGVIDEPLSRADLRTLVVMGVVGFGLSKVLFYLGLQRSVAQDAALIINLEAVFTAVGAAWLLGQRLTGVQWTGAVVACLGGYLLVTPQGAGPQALGHSLGNLLMVAAVVCEALATVLGARLLRRFSGLGVTARGTYWGTAALLGPALWEWHGHAWNLGWATWPNVAGILYLALAATVLAYSLWYHTLQRVRAGQAALFLYLQPLIGVLLAAVLLHSLPSSRSLMGGGLVLTGLLLSSREAPVSA
jgi:drug/metabolite transporter (DMT)-like permease